MTCSGLPDKFELLDKVVDELVDEVEVPDKLDKGERDCAMSLQACCLFSPSWKWTLTMDMMTLTLWQWNDNDVTIIWQRYDNDMRPIWWPFPGQKPDSSHCWGTFATDNMCNGSARPCPPDWFHQVLVIWSLYKYTSSTWYTPNHFTRWSQYDHQVVVILSWAIIRSHHNWRV